MGRDAEQFIVLAVYEGEVISSERYDIRNMSAQQDEFIWVKIQKVGTVLG